MQWSAILCVICMYYYNMRIRFSKTFCACCFCVCTWKTPLTRNPLKWQRNKKKKRRQAEWRGKKDKKDNLFLNTSWQKVAGENGGGKKSSRYLFNFTVEPFWQEAIILFLFFFLHDISASPTRRRIFLCRLSAVDLIFLRPGRYYGNFLGTELQFNFVLTHELLLLLYSTVYGKTRFILQYTYTRHKAVS